VGKSKGLIFFKANNFIRIPLSEILIKSISLPVIAYAKAKQAGLRPLRLRGEIVFGQE
jgi:hypothetical protein